MSYISILWHGIGICECVELNYSFCRVHVACGPRVGHIWLDSFFKNCILFYLLYFTVKTVISIIIGNCLLEGITLKTKTSCLFGMSICIFSENLNMSSFNLDIISKLRWRWMWGLRDLLMQGWFWVIAFLFYKRGKTRACLSLSIWTSMS